MGKAKKNRIQSPPLPSSKVSGRIPEPSPERILNYDDYHPVFCLRYLQDGFDLEACDYRQQASFAKALRKRSQITWQQIWTADRHGLGAEKIFRNSIKASIPRHITEDIDFFIALRFWGTAPMVGYRTKNIFHIVWLDSKYTLYNHS